MNVFRIGVLPGAVLMAACASGPAEPPPALSQAVAQLTADADAVTDGLEPIVIEAEPSVLVVDEQALDDSSNVSCRQMLKPASNVIERICMTKADWKIYERALERHAQRTLRMMQGAAFP